MKNIILILIFTTALMANAKLLIGVSILPQKYFVEAIGKDKVAVFPMVKKGKDPHTYEPTPKQMIEISKADIYYTINVPFEEKWLSKFKNIAKNTLFVNTNPKVQNKHHHNEDHNHHDHEENPHTWLSPKLTLIQVSNIYNSLIKKDPTNKSFYKKNYNLLIQTIKQTDKKIKNILQNITNRTFLVAHPSWGYFAKDYNLTQIPIELHGKKPTSKHIQYIIKNAKKNKIKVIFTSPGFSTKGVKTIAKEIDAKVVSIDPLEYHWQKNLLKLAQEIRNINE